MSTETKVEKDNKWVCASITYASGEYGTETCDVHSDICPPGHNIEGLSDSEYRDFLHKCLDEWLNNSAGSGYFFIGDPDLFPSDE